MQKTKRKSKLSDIIDQILPPPIWKKIFLTPRMNLACESLESLFLSKISKSSGPPDSTDPSDLPNQSVPKNVVFSQIKHQWVP